MTLLDFLNRNYIKTIEQTCPIFVDEENGYWYLIKDDYIYKNEIGKNKNKLFQNRSNSSLRTYCKGISFNEDTNTLIINEHSYGSKKPIFKKYITHYPIAFIKTEEDRCVFRTYERTYHQMKYQNKSDMNDNFKELHDKLYIQDQGREIDDASLEQINALINEQREKQSVMDQQDKIEFSIFEKNLKEKQKKKLTKEFPFLPFQIDILLWSIVVILEIFCLEIFDTIPLLIYILDILSTSLIIPCTIVGFILKKVAPDWFTEKYITGPIIEFIYNKQNKTDMKKIIKRTRRVEEVDKSEKNYNADRLLRHIYDALCDLEKNPYPGCGVEATRLRDLAHQYIENENLSKNKNNRGGIILSMEDTSFDGLSRLASITADIDLKRGAYKDVKANEQIVDKIDQLASDPVFDGTSKIEDLNTTMLKEMKLDTNVEGKAPYQKK